ncbi:phosphofurin acidic cluster sorting protein 1 [Ischnura elegans]|uniref:phosphofurin acidic cluster sorting protein 1 n=1 Tax=Ischnura elegans TaxID=197161 RepID=UPI001ED88BEF|nr:phosphofurin acidic cluster sorting protein 1 [Ischnura elegans]
MDTSCTTQPVGLRARFTFRGFSRLEDPPSGDVATGKYAKGQGLTPPLSSSPAASGGGDGSPGSVQKRLCSLTLSRLVILKALGPDLSSIIIAVKMQSSKRTLRSNEMMLPPGGLLDTELQLNFSLQYPHFLKRDGNKLHVMLQRRKKYKNRTILGFKTLAEGSINMSQVLQRQMDLELDLYSDTKEKSNVVARVTMLSVSSQPVDAEDGTSGGGGGSTDRSFRLHHLYRQKHLSIGENADGRVGGDFSDEDEELFSSNEDGSDSEPMLDETGGGNGGSVGVGVVGSGGGGGGGGGGGLGSAARRARKAARAKIPTNARQRNLKQRFIALLKRFRVSEDLGNDDQEEIDQKLSGGDMDPTEIEDLFEELEDLSDSGPEADTLSISSTPKPSLRPFFSSSRSLLQESLNIPEKGMERFSDESSKKAGDSDSHPETWTDQEHSDPQAPRIQLSHGMAQQQQHQQGAPPGIASSSPPRGSEEKGKQEVVGERRGGRLFARGDRSSGTAGARGRKKSSSLLSTESSHVNVKNTSSGAKSFPISELSSSKSGLQMPRKLLLEQLSRILPPTEDWIPDHVALVSAADPAGALLAARLQERQLKVVTTIGGADVRAALTCLVAKIQKFCNSNAKPPSPIKVILAGSDSFINSVLRHYVEQLSFKSSEWQSYIRFLIIPLGSNMLSRYLGSLDVLYASAFSGDTWRELIERATEGSAASVATSPTPSPLTSALPPNSSALNSLNSTNDSDSLAASSPEWREALSRVQRYLRGATATLQLPIAEAMITYKERSSDDESSQIFIPFVNDVRLGSTEGSTSASVDLDDSVVMGQTFGGGNLISSISSGSNLTGGTQQLLGPVGQSGVTSGSPPAVLQVGQQNPSLHPSLQGSGPVPASPAVTPGPDPLSVISIPSQQQQQVMERRDGQGNQRTTPPGSPNFTTLYIGQQPLQQQTQVQPPNRESLLEPMELQLDYWLSPGKGGDGGTMGGVFGSVVGGGGGKGAKGDAPSATKSTLKTTFRSLAVQRLPPFGEVPTPHFLISYSTKEKKQKIMRLGKKKEKDKESEPKSQVVDGVSRLICSPKTHNIPMRVCIDGTEWAGVKFFQLSAQWQTHIKHFPVALFALPDTST